MGFLNFEFNGFEPYALTPAGQPRKILTAAAANPKTAKGEKLPYVAALLHLAPANRSGHNTCSHASERCRYVCLNTAGHGGINLVNDSNHVQRTRIAKTKWLFEYQQHFLSQLWHEINAMTRKAERLGKHVAIRLNGTSDLAWERLKFADTGLNLFEAFPEVQFYDYTKVISRLTHGTVPENYHLTFSLSECNDRHAAQALERGYNVAAVLRLKDHDPMPQSWGGYPVIDGTEHDFRFLDERIPGIVALRPKGRAKYDTSGFVRDLDGGLDVSRVPVLAIQADKTAQRAALSLASI